MGAAPSHEPAAPTPPRTRLGARPPSDGAPVAGYDLASAAASRVVGAAPVPTRAGSGFGRDKGPAVGFAAPVQRRAIVTNVVSLQRGSVKAVRAPGEAGERGVFLVEFLFDAQVPGCVTVYHCATRAVKGVGGVGDRVEKVSFKCLDGERPSKTRFGAGGGQRYQQKVEKGLDTVRWKNEILQKDGERWPIVVRLEACYPEDSPVPTKERVVAQMTMVSLTENDDGEGYRCVVMRQDVLVDGTLYKLQELYGIAADVTASKDESAKGDSNKPAGFTFDDKGNECVICLTEPCTVVVRPCNHLCLCVDCSERLVSGSNFEKRRCPICRSPLGSLLPIFGGVDGNNEGETREAEKVEDVTSSVDALNVDYSDVEGDTARADSAGGESSGVVEPGAAEGDGSEVGPGCEAEGEGSTSAAVETSAGASSQASSGASKGAQSAVGGSGAGGPELG